MCSLVSAFTKQVLLPDFRGCLHDFLRQNAVVTCTRRREEEWKRRKGTHNEASNLEEMTNTKPAIEAFVIKWDSKGQKGV